MNSTDLSTPSGSTAFTTSLSEAMTNILATTFAITSGNISSYTTIVTPPSLVFEVSRTTYNYLAVYTGFLTVFGILNNGLVMLLFYRYQSLRIPINSFLLNLTLSDFIVSLFASPFTFAANVAGKWIYGSAICSLYAFIVTVAGTEQIVILAIISVHRCLLVVRPFTAQKLTHGWALLFIALSWLYSVIISLPPIFGWNEYVIEGPGTACSVNWNSNRPTDTSYIIFIFVFVLVVPLITIIVSYVLLIYAVKKISSTQAAQSSTNKADKRVTKMVALMVFAFLFAWTPYAVFSLYVAFGENVQVGPVAATLPAFFAKLCTVYNPIIYFLMNKQFKDALIDFVFRGENPFDREESNSDHGRGGRTMATSRSTRAPPLGRQGRSSSLPTTTSVLDIPQAVQREADDPGPSTSSKRVFELSSNVQKFEVAEQSKREATSLKPPKRLKNKVASLPPVAD